MIPESPRYSVPLLTGRDVVRVILAVLGLTIGLVVTAAFLYSVLLVLGVTETTLTLSLPVLFLAEAIAIFGGIHAALVRPGLADWRDLGWEHVSPAWLVVAGVGSIAFFAGGLAVQMLAREVTQGAAIELPGASEFFPRDVFGFLSVLFLSAVVVPIAEEFLFRGVLFRWIRDRWSFWPAALGSAAAFALLHPPTAGSTPMIFLIGLALAALYEKSGSLWPSMILHGVNNAVGIMFIYLTFWFSGA